MTGVAAARHLAEHWLAPLGDRWLHVQAVAAKAADLGKRLGRDDRESLVTAALLHDIGYAPELAATCFHPLDGAVHLRAAGWGANTCSLVAHHSGASYEAEERGLVEELATFPLPDRADLLDLLTYCDMTTGPRGQDLRVDERLTEILDRYPPEDPVHRAVLRSRQEIIDTVKRGQELFLAD